jgi:hypothetical protein
MQRKAESGQEQIAHKMKLCRRRGRSQDLKMEIWWMEIVRGRETVNVETVYYLVLATPKLRELGLAPYAAESLMAV